MPVKAERYDYSDYDRSNSLPHSAFSNGPHGSHGNYGPNGGVAPLKSLASPVKLEKPIGDRGVEPPKGIKVPPRAPRALSFESTNASVAPVAPAIKQEPHYTVPVVQQNHNNVSVVKAPTTSPPQELKQESRANSNKEKLPEEVLAQVESDGTVDIPGAVKDDGDGDADGDIDMLKAESLEKQPVVSNTAVSRDSSVEPVVAPDEKPDEKPDGEPATKLAEKITEEAAEKIVAEPVEKPAEKIVEEPVDEPVEEPLTEPLTEPILAPVTDSKPALQVSTASPVKGTSATAHVVTSAATAINYSSVTHPIFPMRKAELAAWELRHSSRPQLPALKHLNPVRNDFSQYSFLEANVLMFKQADAFTLYRFFRMVDAACESKASRLTSEWAYRARLWHADLKFYDSQLQELYQTETAPPVVKREEEKPKSGRRNRHGDSVRTEAEFMEILKSLEQERERDPLVRAQYGAATIPTMLLDPTQEFQYASFVDMNNLKTDKDQWASRMLTDPLDNFTPAEHERFVQAYLMYPKRFGKISQHMGGLRSSEDCVLHYYRTKRTTNYKQLLANKNKKNKRAKAVVKKKKRKGEEEAETGDVSETRAGSQTETPLEDTSVDFYPTRKAKTGITVPKKRFAETPEVDADEDGEERTESRGAEEESTLETAADVSVSAAVSLGQAGPMGPPLEDSNKDAADTSVNVNNSNVSTALASVSASVSASASASASAATPDVPTTGTAPEERKRKKRRTDEGHSSYWSVQEINKFPMLLQQFGSEWEEIAKVLKTKTAAMARNYYQRSLNDHPDWRAYVVGDGEAGGPPVGLFYKKPASYTSAQAIATAAVPEGEVAQVAQAATEDGTDVANNVVTDPSINGVNAKVTKDDVSTTMVAPEPSAPTIDTPAADAAGATAVHSTPIVQAQTELADIPRAPVRASIMSLLNEDKPRDVDQPPATSVPAVHAGINGLAAVAGLYANSEPAPEVAKEEFRTMMAKQQLPSSAQAASAPATGLSALNALAKVAFEHN